MILEKFPETRRILLATTLVASGLGVVACGNTEGSPNTIERCFDQPLPPRPDPTPHAELISLKERDGVMTGDPGKLPDDLHTQLEGSVAIVDVASPNGRGGRGRGFLTLAGNKRVVVTAAHVVLGGLGAETGSPSSITVTDAKGRVSGVKDGCYVYEDSVNQEFAPPPQKPKDSAPANPESPPPFSPKEPINDRDVAVLELDKPLGDSLLPLSNGPQRGKWDTAGILGRPGNATSRDLTTYNTVAVGAMGGASNKAYWYIGGLQRKERERTGLDSSTYGASGAPIVARPSGPSISNNPPLVVNGIVGGSWPDGYMSEDQIRDSYKFAVEPFDRKTISTDYVIPSQDIQEVLEAVK